MGPGPQEDPPRRHLRYDQLMKWLLTRAHDGFLALVAPGLTWQGERSPEVPSVAHYADLVWEVERNNGQRGLLHVELQLKVEDDIGERLAEYAIRLYRRDQLPVRSVVVFLRMATTVPASPFVIPWEEHDTRSGTPSRSSASGKFPKNRSWEPATTLSGRWPRSWLARRSRRRPRSRGDSRRCPRPSKSAAI